MDLIKVSKIQMYFWFIVTGVCLIMVIILLIQERAESWYISVPAITAVLALLRRWQWKRLTKSKAEMEANKNKK
ncbi:hypothetical protein K6119_10465 [Paracrocinitomix mangrovi]|uniref:hypothetical protein n=1 Tax=Paracrocinitomix mangrovi TaxID=2862509 RepID=UPI001C8EBB69|nr:hypothetical protein [Paracrocinitomix mangrovi]UKN00157.1 hypothetical protein K6119_10465 [Paracrocinitomix mangrovi]